MSVGFLINHCYDETVLHEQYEDYDYEKWEKRREAVAVSFFVSLFVTIFLFVACVIFYKFMNNRGIIISAVNREIGDKEIGSRPSGVSSVVQTENAETEMGD